MRCPIIFKAFDSNWHIDDGKKYNQQKKKLLNKNFYMRLSKMYNDFFVS